MQIVDACTESLQCLETLSEDLQMAIRCSFIKSIGDGFSKLTYFPWPLLTSFTFNSFCMREHLRLPRVLTVRRAI